jgi:hypothetical protein
LIADHILAEIPVQTQGQGRTLDEWRHLPNRPDNHYFDVLCGAAATASFLGCILPGSGAVPVARKQPRKVSFAALAADARSRGA